MRRLYHVPRAAHRRRYALAALIALVAIVLGLVRAPLAFAQHDEEPVPAAPAAAPAAPAASVAPPSAPSAALPPAAVASALAARAAPSASASSSAGARGPLPGEIRVHEKIVVTLRAARAGHSAQDRAKAANVALDGLLAQNEDMGEARFEETQGTAVVYVGKTPIVTLGEEDVEAAGEASLTVVAAQVTARLGQAVSTERKRSAIATTVFSFSLLVFSALLAFLFLNRVSEGAAKLRGRIGDNPEKVTALRLGKIEFISAGAARGALSIGLALGHRFIQIAIAYGWLIFALSLFEATRGYTERLTGMVVKPLYGLAARIGGALPLVVVAALAVLAISVLVRFVGLFFDSVSRGDTRVAWLSRDLARPTSVLARFGIVVVALVLASPLITGETDGVLSRVGLIALVAVAIAATPLLASVIVGITVLFGRRMKRGDDVEVGGRKGKVLDVTLLEVRLEDDALAEVSVPHLLGLVHPTRVHRHARLATIDIVVEASAAQDEVERALFAAARAHSSRGRVELIHLDGTGAHWRIVSASMRHYVSLAKAVQDALTKLGVGLGRSSARKVEDASVRPEET
jgi:small-conductance mechanosensitive channel